MLRLKDKPFEILAISLDDERDILAHMLENKKVPGIHTWDDKGRENPIAEQYNVLDLPVWYLLDDKGVIRARDPFEGKLVPAVNAIFKPGKAGKGKNDQ